MHLEHEKGEHTMNDAARSLRANPSPSEVLAGFTAGLDLADVPDEVVAYARVLMLDLLGVAPAGVDAEETVLATLRRPKRG